MPAQPGSNPEQPSKPSPKDAKSVWVGAERYIQLGMTLPAATVIGWLLGELLQRWLHWDWLPLGGLIFGIIAGFVYFIRTAMSEEFKD
ncbi:MAG: AtpZ/AtpI family protein [Acidobacteriia bacterium]|nr:AtpZ/AtpI family protein [Terriglobia bacterium]